MACVLHQLSLLFAALAKRRKHGVKTGCKLLYFAIALDVERVIQLASERNLLGCFHQLLNWLCRSAGSPPTGDACSKYACCTKTEHPHANAPFGIFNVADVDGKLQCAAASEWHDEHAVLDPVNRDCASSYFAAGAVGNS